MTAAKSSDLKLRILSAIVMVAIAGLALWAGGLVFSAFVGAVALWAIWEWWGLAKKIAASWRARAAWLAIGIAYIGSAAYILSLTGSQRDTKIFALILIGIVIATDVGAYATGRTFGGPKIAPSISPSKTWSGLAGGVVAAGFFVVAMTRSLSPSIALRDLVSSAMFGVALAVVAQSGDFFESWMKRKAGVKDSGATIPGHGGVLDRIDGLVPVTIVGTVVFLVLIAMKGGI